MITSRNLFSVALFVSLFASLDLFSMEEKNTGLIEKGFCPLEKTKKNKDIDNNYISKYASVRLYSQLLKGCKEFNFYANSQGTIYDDQIEKLAADALGFDFKVDEQKQQVESILKFLERILPKNPEQKVDLQAVSREESQTLLHLMEYFMIEHDDNNHKVISSLTGKITDFLLDQLKKYQSGNSLLQKIFSKQKAPIEEFFQCHKTLLDDISKYPYRELIIKQILKKTDLKVSCFLKESKKFCGHTQPINCVNFSPDSTTIVTASNDKTAKIWDIEMGECIATFDDRVGHTDDVLFAEFSPKGDRLITASSDLSVKIWNLEEEKLIFTFRDFPDSVKFAVIDSGKILAVSGYKLYYCEMGVNACTELKDSDFFYKPIAFCAFIPSSTKAIVTVGNKIRIFDLSVNSHCDVAPEGSKDKSRICKAALNRDCKKLITVHGDKSCKIWDLEKWEIIPINNKEKKSCNGDSSSVSFGQDDTVFMTAFGKIIKITDIKKGLVLYNLKNTKDVCSAKFSPDGKFIAFASGNEAKIWKLDEIVGIEKRLTKLSVATILYVYYLLKSGKEIPDLDELEKMDVKFEKQ